MNSHGAGRPYPKRRRTTTKLHSRRLLDLNCPPAEGAVEGSSPFIIMPFAHSEASSSMPAQHIQASSSMPLPTGEPRIGMHSCPIDVEAIDDDVVIYSSRSLPQVCALVPGYSAVLFCRCAYYFGLLSFLLMTILGIKVEN